ncbi:MAG: chemotaxis protein CheW [Firmicutes bacterium]|nr:chemotaxis protein CheW [Bacillota bacterium]
MQLVVFRLAGELYGVDIQQVREIIRVPEVTRVPRTPDFVEGVINLRGSVIPVLDLRKRFRLPAGEADRERRIVVVEMGEQTLGVIVDAVSEVLRLDQDRIEPPSPYIVNVDSQYITGIARLEDRLIILLDLNKVLSAGEREELERLEEPEQDGRN